ncbi:hypothetical protein GJ496_002957 [Pomphorhynchus laevis]|nr:hypothetical protein GJ496_002957 [Pomphorhynchus laevis]
MCFINAFIAYHEDQEYPWLQCTINNAILRTLIPNFTNTSSQIYDKLRARQMFQIPENNKYMINNVFKIIPYILILAYIIPISSISNQINFERISGLTLNAETAGISRSASWLALWIQSCCTFTVISIVISLLYTLTANRIFTYTSTLSIILILLCYSASCISFAITFTKLLKPSTSVPAKIVIGWLSSAVLIHAIVNKLVSYPLQVAVCYLFPNAAMSYIFGIVSKFENFESGAPLHAIKLCEDENNVLTLNFLLFSMLMNSVVYSLIGIHSSFVKTFKLTKLRLSENSNGSTKINNTDSPCLSVKNITKRFRTEHSHNYTSVLSDCSFNVAKGEIAVLYGCNGSGKSTVLSIISGQLRPDIGEVMYNNAIISSKSDKHRNIRFIGYCGQANIFYDDLTVYENIYFFGKIRSQTFELFEMEEYMHMLHLHEYKNTRAINLSGGKKRSLCIACALAGGSKVLLFDEPSSGLDQRLRSEFWSLLNRVKQDNIIVVATHYLNEAEIIADTIIAFNGDGGFSWVGSSTQYQSEYG